jgi:hypothetical protein
MVSTDTNYPSEKAANSGLFAALQDFWGPIRTHFHA